MNEQNFDAVADAVRPILETDQYPPEIAAEYERLRSIIRQAVYCVDFPFGVVGPIRRRLDEIEQKYPALAEVNS